jgi:hypothetical protein
VRVLPFEPDGCVRSEAPDHKTVPKDFAIAAVSSRYKLSSEITGEFVERMEGVLCVYARPYDPKQSMAVSMNALSRFGSQLGPAHRASV